MKICRLLIAHAQSNTINRMALIAFFMRLHCLLSIHERCCWRCKKKGMTQSDKIGWCNPNAKQLNNGPVVWHDIYEYSHAHWRCRLDVISIDFVDIWTIEPWKSPSIQIHRFETPQRSHMNGPDVFFRSHFKIWLNYCHLMPSFSVRSLAIEFEVHFCPIESFKFTCFPLGFFCCCWMFNDSKNNLQLIIECIEWNGR